MPNYEFQCTCERSISFEKFLPIADRDKPLSEPCPECSKEDCIQRVQGVGKMVYNTKDVLTRAGSQFQEIQAKIVEYTGKKHHNMRLK